MNSFCLSNAVDLNSLLSLRLNDQVDMFLELAQLAQLESLEFLNVFGVQNLIESDLVLGRNQLQVLHVPGLNTGMSGPIITTWRCGIANCVSLGQPQA